MKRILFVYFSFLISHISFAQNGTWFWGRNGIGDGYIGNVVTDYKGDCYLSGQIPNDTIRWGADTLRNSTITNHPYSSDFDPFLVKYDHNGNMLWAKQNYEKNSNPNVGNIGSPSVCADNRGNAYLAFNFIDTIYVGGYTFISPDYTTVSQDTYLAKYDGNGNVLWAKQAICINDSSFIVEDYISYANHGNIYVTGIFGDSIRLGGNIIATPFQSKQSMFLVKYDSNGNVLWAKQANGVSQGLGVTNDKNGNIFITGGFNETVRFGSYTLVALSSSDFFIVKYDSSGNALWAKQATVPTNNSEGVGISIATDLSGNVYATGDFLDTIIFNQDTLIGPNSYSYQYSFFVVKYDQNGNLLWAKEASILDGNPWQGWSISVDNSKHLYLSANGGAGNGANNEIAFGGDTLRMKDTVKFDAPSVILKLDSNGNALCGSMIPVGGANNGSTMSICDTSGNYVYIEGEAKSIAVFGKDTVNPLSYPSNVIQGGNFFPFIARWEECDSNVLYAGVQNPKPVGAEVKVYPNPSTGQFTFDFNVPVAGTIEVYDITGQRIYQQIVQSEKTVINLTGQPAGMYFYRVVAFGGTLIGEGKVVKE